MPRNRRSLTDEQARWALQAIADSQVTMAQAAEKLQVSQSVIGDLARGRTYLHLPRPASLALPRPRSYRGYPETPERRTLREAKFWALVDKAAGEAGCWSFRGRRNADGYGEFSAGKALTGAVSAHRVAYLLARGLNINLPVKTFVRHLCANPRCCNPAHLTTGTQADNMSDRFRLHQNQPGPHRVATPTPPPAGGWKIAVGNITELERAALEAEFWQKINRGGGDTACWPWTGASRHDFGYGSVYWEHRHTQAARVAYVLHHGLSLADLPGNLVLRHLCPDGGNPGCCNPFHLALGTQKQNMHDRMSEGKYSRGDGHFATKVSNRAVEELRVEYWHTPRGQRPTLASLAQRHHVYWGTIHRWLRGAGRTDVGGPTGEPTDDAQGLTNHVHGEAHRMVKVPDSQVRELREEYWGLPPRQRPSTVSLATRLGTDSKTVWNWLHGKSRASAGGPTGEPGVEKPVSGSPLRVG